MKKHIFKVASLLLLPSVCFAGTITSMNQDEVTNILNEKTITTITAATLNGNIIADKFTGYFSKDGKMSSSFSPKTSNAPQTDTGTWRVSSDGMMCFKWQNWDSGKERCVSLYKLNNSILVTNSQNGFESLILNKDIVSGNRLATSKQ